MVGPVSDAASLPERILSPGEILIVQGEQSGDLFVLESGQLAVERDGVAVTTLTEPGTLVGEMSILLNKPNTATVRAEGYASVRVMHEARAVLGGNADLALGLAALVAGRLDATTALLVHLSSEHTTASERSLVGKILSAINRPAPLGNRASDGASPWGFVGRAL